ncbi:MAG: M64 family metallopeptidase [Bacteroidales bacterium]|nr:M64 family metallopeptidase [Bacteroidales bacterium]
MKKIFLTMIAFCALSVQAQTFEQYFIQKTMRVDYMHVGDAVTDQYFIDEIIAEPHWGGHLTNLIDESGFGYYLVKVFDKQTKTLIYSRYYATLFGEWQTTDEAKTIQKSFSETVVFPFPKNKIEVALHTKNKATGIFEEKYRFDIDPNNYFIQRDRRHVYPVYEVESNGNPNEKVDIVIIPDGYTESEMNQFMKDCDFFRDEFFKYEPYSSYRDRFNIHAVMAPSKESGADLPGENIWKNTLIDCSFWTFDSERYLMTTDNKTMRDVAANAPCDQIYILVNHQKYGGGGIFNHYCTGINHNESAGKIIVHEFGHGFAGLGDEYVGNAEYNDFYNLKLEPADPNVTTLVDFESKWKDLVDPQTPIPTPATPQYKNQIGVFEGAGYMKEGIYRPKQDCLMNHFRCEEFCPVCQRAIIKMIDFYTVPVK